MTQNAQATSQTGGSSGSPAALPISLQTSKPSRGLWADAMLRLFRNRMAVLGLVIIVVMVLCAIFAGLVAPVKDVINAQNTKEPIPAYAVTNQKLGNAVPGWLLNWFPSVKPKGSENGYATVSDQFILGSDYLGRDILTRLIYGLGFPYLWPLSGQSSACCSA